MLHPLPFLLFLIILLFPSALSPPNSSHPFRPSSPSSPSSASLPRCPPRCSCAHSTVICTGLGLTRVPPGIPPDTLRLDLQENRIPRLHAGDFANLTSLRILHLGDNAIEEVEKGALDPLVSLERLRMNRNRIRALPEGMLAGTGKLRRLDLSENGLWSVSAEQLAGPVQLVALQLDRNHLQCVDAQALSQWASLESLSLASNALSTLSQLNLMAMPNLRNLRLSDNPWHCDCRLRWLKRLKIASQIRCHRPTHLYGRSLDQISIQQLKCSGMEKRSSGAGGRRCRDADWCPPGCTCTESSPDSVIVDCHDRLLRSVPQRLPPNTVELRLEQNRLTHLDNRSFAAVPNLVRLDLSKNAIERVDVDAFAGLRRLNSLMLFANNLTDLPEGLFAPMGSSLQVLLLNGNRLRCLRNGLFRGVDKLKLLSLYDNQIRSITERSFASFSHSLQTLHLARNPLICDCNMAWMARWLAARPIETSGARCHSPKRMARRRIGAALAPERFKCNGAERLVTRGAGECAVDRECPEQCQCRGTTVDCSSLPPGSAPPASIPHFASSLLIRSNSLSHLSHFVDVGPLPNLVHLDLSDNNLDSISSDFFSAFPSLRELDLSGNSLRRLNATALGPSALTLITLHLDGNSLRCLALDQFPSLRSLSLRQNPLLTLQASPVQFDQLEVLGLDSSSRFICDCQLRPLIRQLRRMGKNWTEEWEVEERPRCAEPEKLAGKPLTELEEAELNCQDNAIGGHCSADGEFCPSSCSCHRQPPSLALFVRCSGLGLSRVPRGLPPDTVELFLDNNRIGFISSDQFSGLPRLTKLDLSHNLIRHIPSGTFASLPSLSSLILAYNRIQCIHNGAFDGVTQLRVLSLHDNDLSRLLESAFAPLLANLSHVALGDNPFWCDCEMNWTGRWLRSKFVEPGIAKCEGPPQRKDQLLLSADPFPECSSPNSDQSPTPVSVLAKCQPCLASPCANSAQCHPLPIDRTPHHQFQFRCECPPGFHGLLCDQRVDACFGQPCQNGGTCQVMRRKKEGPDDEDRDDNGDEKKEDEDEGRFRCECPPGFAGDRCERERDECEEDGGREQCRNGATCRDQMNGFHCDCSPGFVGPFCESHICLNSPPLSPCQNGGICIPHDGELGHSAITQDYPEHSLGYNCLCPEGFSGQNCTIPRGVIANCAENGIDGEEGAICEALVASGKIQMEEEGGGEEVEEDDEKRRRMTRMERAREEAEERGETEQKKNGIKENSPPSEPSPLCPFAFTGPNCTRRRAVGLAGPGAFLRMNGWPMTENGGERRIEVVIRTRQRGGVVLFAGDPSAAFVLLELVQGRLRGAILLSPAHSPPSQLFSLTNVDDGLPHSVLLRLHGQHLSLRVDSLPLQSVLNSGPLPHLALPDDLPFFIGGIPSELGRRALIQFRLSDTSGIRGCFSDIRLNGSPFDLNAILGDQNSTKITECPEAADFCLGQNCGKGKKCRMDEKEVEGWKCEEEEEKKGEEEGKKRMEEGRRGGRGRKKCSRERHPGRGGKAEEGQWAEGRKCRIVQPLPICGGHCEENGGRECCVAVQKRKRRVRVKCRKGGRRGGGEEEEEGEQWRMVEVPRKCGCARREEQCQEEGG